MYYIAHISRPHDLDLRFYAITKLFCMFIWFQQNLAQMAWYALMDYLRKYQKWVQVFVNPQEIELKDHNPPIHFIEQQKFKKKHAVFITACLLKFWEFFRKWSVNWKIVTFMKIYILTFFMSQTHISKHTLVFMKTAAPWSNYHLWMIFIPHIISADSNKWLKFQTISTTLLAQNLYFLELLQAVMKSSTHRDIALLSSDSSLYI